MINKLLLIILLSFTILTRESTAASYKVYLDEKIDSSVIILEGRVISCEPFINKLNGYIYTSNIVEITKLFKGVLFKEEIEIITPGGRLDSVEWFTCPAIRLQKDETGIFFLNKSEIRSSAFDIYSWNQGFIKYNPENMTASCPFSQYNNIKKDLWEYIELRLQKSLQFIKKNEILNEKINIRDEKKEGDELQVSITSFSPASVRAGTGDNLTIYGTDFGTVRGTIRFRDPDYGGAIYANAPVSSILSWGNTQITVRVPTTACSGTFQVVTSGNQTATSGNINVPFSILNTTYPFTIFLVNLNNLGGYTYQFTNAFFANERAVAAFKRALQTWRCRSYVNFGLSDTQFFSDCPTSDGINTVAFSSSSCPLPAGALAVTWYSYSYCANSSYMSEMDTQFNLNFSFNYEQSWSCTNCYDFETIALHELGHSHCLGHSASTNDLMYYSVNMNQAKRTPFISSDMAGADFIMENSTSSGRCSRQAMIALNDGNCQLGFPPVAEFSAMPRNGCSPLTVDFTNESQNNPTSYFWDIDNNGTIDYTVANPSHTYTQAGLYSVKLIVQNSSGSDTIIKGDYVNVNPRPQVQMNGLFSVCENHQLVYTAQNPSGCSFQWTVYGGTIIGSDVSSSVTVSWGNPPQGSIRLVQVINSTGCRDTIFRTVTINSVPIASISGRNNVCGMSLQNYNAQPQPNVTYRWEVTGGIVTTPDDQSNVTIQWDSSGTGRIRLFVVNNSNFCNDSTFRDIQIFPLPDVRINGITTVCSKRITVFESFSPDGENLWLVVGGQIEGNSNGNSVRIIWDKPGTGRLKLVKKNVNTNCVDSNEIQVRIIDKPFFSINGKNEICNGVITRYFVSPKPAGDIITGWVIEKGFINSFSQNSDTIDVIWNSPGTGILKAITQQELSGCIDTVYFEVTVKPKPDTKITGPVSACLNCTTSYSVLNNNAGNLWSAEGGDILNSQTDSVVKIKWTKKGSGFVKVIQTNSFGCSDSDLAVVNITSIPDMVITGPEKVCEGTDTIYTNPSPDSIKKLWSVNNGIIKSRNDSSLVRVLWDNKGTGQVLLKLTDSDAGYSDSVELNVEVMPQPPKPVITFDGTYLYSSNPNGNQWYFEGLAIKGATDAKLKPDKFGNYSVQVTGNNGCISGISEAFNVEPGYTASEDEFRSIILFPNPAENDIEICLNNFPDEMAKISLSNILGEIVVEDSVAPLTKKYISSINVNSLANGIYLVRVSIGNINFTKSVIIKK